MRTDREQIFELARRQGLAVLRNRRLLHNGDRAGDLGSGEGGAADRSLAAVKPRHIDHHVLTGRVNVQEVAMLRPGGAGRLGAVQGANRDHVVIGRQNINTVGSVLAAIIAAGNHRCRPP